MYGPVTRCSNKNIIKRFSCLVPLMLSPLLVNLYIPLWQSTTALFSMPHLVSGMNFPKNFANLLIMNPCHCHLIILSPVHHHHHRHYHHFHYTSLCLCSTPDSKLTFSINPSQRSLLHLFRRISRIFMTISRLNCSSVFLLFCFFIFFVWFVW